MMSNTDPLLVVEASFQLSRPGLVLMPSVSPAAVGSEQSGHAAEVELLRPDGSRERVQAVFYWEHLNPGGFRYVCVLPSSSKEQVPPGTEVRLVRDGQP